MELCFDHGNSGSKPAFEARGSFENIHWNERFYRLFRILTRPRRCTSAGKSHSKLNLLCAESVFREPKFLESHVEELSGLPRFSPGFSLAPPSCQLLARVPDEEWPQSHDPSVSPRQEL